MMLQVYWYTSLMALTPQPPNADAFAGMALGATIGERCSRLLCTVICIEGQQLCLAVEVAVAPFSLDTGIIMQPFGC
jgi:hypothetical protein